MPARGDHVHVGRNHRLLIIDAIMEMNPKLDRSQLDKASKKEVLGRAKCTFKNSARLPEPLRVGASSTLESPAAFAAE